MCFIMPIMRPCSVHWGGGPSVAEGTSIDSSLFQRG
jgi:hypothetical protein